MSAPMAGAAADLVAALRVTVGAEHVLTDPAARAFASADLFSDFEPALTDIVVRPGATAEVAKVVALLREAGAAILPRAAGLSYSGGAVSQIPAVVIDTRRLDSVEVVADDLYARVGSGCSWAKLAQALRPYGLRAAHPSPISGSHSTVGGTLAQGITGGMEGVLGLTVVLADGTVARTGAGARSGASPFFRHFGPDLTGLFLGDCGAFGVKTEIVLRLTPLRPTAFASFAFTHAGEAIAALVETVARGTVARGFLLDPLKNSLLDSVSVPEALRTVRGVMSQGTTVSESLRAAWRMATERHALSETAWSLHLIADAPTQVAADSAIEAARTLCGARGREIADVVPRALQANPYTISGFLGPDGERWAPIHGVLPPSRAAACFGALERHIHARRPELDALGVQAGWFIAAGGPYVTIESMFYWRDSLTPVHLAYLAPGERAKAAARAENPAARQRAGELRREHRDIMDAHEAVHLQVGRYYRYTDLMDADSRALVTRVKQALDPDGIMNPGALGLGVGGTDNLGRRS